MVFGLAMHEYCVHTLLFVHIKLGNRLCCVTLVLLFEFLGIETGRAKNKPDEKKSLQCTQSVYVYLYICMYAKRK